MFVSEALYFFLHTSLTHFLLSFTVRYFTVFLLLRIVSFFKKIIFLFIARLRDTTDFSIVILYQALGMIHN